MRKRYAGLRVPASFTHTRRSAAVTHGTVANALFWQVAPDLPQLCAVATHGRRQVGRGRAIPFAGHIAGRDGDLPPDGWDRVLSWGRTDRTLGRTPDTVSPLRSPSTRHTSGGVCPAGS